MFLEIVFWFFLINKRTLIFRAIWVTHLELMKFLFWNIYKTVRIKRIIYVWGCFFFFFFLLLSLAVLGLRCCVWAFSSSSEQGAALRCSAGLLTVVASLVAEYKLQALGFQELSHMDLVALRHVESSQTKDWTHPLPWQTDSYPLSHQGCPRHICIYILKLKWHDVTDLRNKRIHLGHQF